MNADLASPSENAFLCPFPVLTVSRHILHIGTIFVLHIGAIDLVGFDSLSVVKDLNPAIHSFDVDLLAQIRVWTGVEILLEGYMAVQLNLPIVIPSTRFVGVFGQRIHARQLFFDEYEIPILFPFLKLLMVVFKEFLFDRLFQRSE